MNTRLKHENATLEELEQHTAGDFHPGDLLCSVLRVEPGSWEGKADVRQQVAAIVERARALAPLEGKVVARAIEEAVTSFTIAGGRRSNRVLKGRRTKRARTRHGRQA